MMKARYLRTLQPGLTCRRYQRHQWRRRIHQPASVRSALAVLTQPSPSLGSGTVLRASGATSIEIKWPEAAKYNYPLPNFFPHENFVFLQGGNTIVPSNRKGFRSCMSFGSRNRFVMNTWALVSCSVFGSKPGFVQCNVAMSIALAFSDTCS